MIDFWIAAGLLLLAALAFLLLPVLRGRRLQQEEDRTALNVALYQERLAELEAQAAAGALAGEALEQARAEAARELLEDTEGDEGRRQGSLGRAVPLAVACLVPLIGYGLYAHWGASDKVALTREFATPPTSAEQMIDRLERSVALQPESAESWYVLGRAYMAQERPRDAAPAFARAVDLAGPQAELLGQWAQALYFAGNRQWTEQLQNITRDALTADPAEPTTLGLLGIVAFESGLYRDAVRFWSRLVAVLPEEDPSRQAIQGGIERARAELAARGEADSTPPADAPAAGEAAPARVTVEVALAPSLREQVRPDDTVFVFARAAEGPPMPLAVKRLRVADLPATVELGDADAMMPQLQMSKFPRIRLAARISRAGDATRGEWVGQGDVLDLPVEGAKTLTIDRPDAS